MSKNLDMCRLLDLYGGLLTEKQFDIMDLYYNDDLSLGEIADHYDISRQGVHDAIKRGDEALAEYEAKLGLLKADEERKNEIAALRELALDAFVDVLVGVGVEVGGGGETLDFLEEEVGEETVVLRVEREGCLVGSSGEEDDGVRCLAGLALGFLGFGVFGHGAVGAEHGSAVALVAVEGGVDDDGEAADGVDFAFAASFEHGAEGVEGEALRGEAGVVLAREGYVVVGFLISDF